MGRAGALQVFTLATPYLTVDSGDTFQLTVAARDAYGTPLDVSGTLTYVSSDTGVATVSRTGLLAARAPGTVVVSAAASLGGLSRRSTAEVNVVDPGVSPAVRLFHAPGGWEPAAADIGHGAAVRWIAGTMDWRIPPRVYVVDADYRIVDTLVLLNGAASRRFDVPGTYHYCSGACWDPPEFGTIRVH